MAEDYTLLGERVEREKTSDFEIEYESDEFECGRNGKRVIRGTARMPFDVPPKPGDFLNWGVRCIYYRPDGPDSCDGCQYRPNGQIVNLKAISVKDVEIE